MAEFAPSFRDSQPIPPAEEEGEVVVFTADGTEYGVNGTAMDAGYRKIAPIWKKDPTGLTPRVNIGDVIDRGLALCR